MSTITVPRANLTTDEVVTALRDRLGENYNVLPGMAIGRTSLQYPHKGQPNMIVVGIAENRIVKAQVTITRRGGQTEIRISPGGLTWDLVVNTFVARKIRRVLTSSPDLSAC
jgi:acyl-[acyl carrier protein]--UDP-N-acetylglucosamine O-acyltransferase